MILWISSLSACGGGGGGGGASPPVALPSNNAALSALTFAAVTLDQTFSGTILDYSAAAEFVTTETRVTATTAHPGARITINGVAIASGVASDAVSLDVGSNLITVRVTAEDGTTVREYTIAVNRQALTQRAYVKASNTGEADFFGDAVALSADGQTLVVGAPGEAASAGAAYVFRRGIDGAWSQEAFLKGSNTNFDDFFGTAVAVSEDGATVAVGAWGEDSLGNDAPSSGAVYVFTRTGQGVWSEDAYLKAANADAGDLFGEKIALSDDGSILAVGASFESGSAIGVNGDQFDNGAMESGAAYVFARDGQGNWTQQAYIKASNTTATDYFGSDLALSGDGRTLAVGSFDDSLATGINGNQTIGGAEFSGAVFVFTRDTGDVWTQEAYIKASNTGTDDLFGVDGLALTRDGSTLAVGARFEDSAARGVNGDQGDDTSDNSGAVYVFTRTTGTWSQQAYIKASNTDSGDGFGRSVALAADGNILVVGATGEDGNAIGVNGDESDNTAASSGAVYVFSRSSDDSWSQQIYIKASNTGGNDRFGYDLALSGDATVLSIGAWGEDSAATGVGGDQADDSAPAAGAVYIFEP